MVSRHRSDPTKLTAFGSGSLTNIALGKFGPASSRDVRWVAGLGMDYGVIAVRADAPYRNLHELLTALEKAPATTPIGIGGPIGSQDWMKLSLIAKQGGINPARLSFVALDSGAEAFIALISGHVQVVAGDASIAQRYLGSQKIRLLAVLASSRLPGRLAHVPTASEQGVEVLWPVIRGVYMGPQVKDEEYRLWVERFDRMLASESFSRLRAAEGLHPFGLTGEALADYVQHSIDHYRKQARMLGLSR